MANEQQTGFETFLVNSTNVFPMANSVTGGQYATEFNLRSRESVSTNPQIQYMVGPSYTHSANDYMLYSQEQDPGLTASQIEILAGRAVVNGHYVENTLPMIIDMAQTTLSGVLKIGIRIYYSTDNLTIGAIQPNAENSEVYTGVKVVILPADEFKTPIDVPTEPDKVTAHLLLGSFTYSNNRVSDVRQNADKLQMFDSSRIALGSSASSESGSSSSGSGIDFDGLDPMKLYALTGGNATHVKDATQSLIVWDNEVRSTPSEPSDKVAHFESTNTETNLVLPHLQPLNNVSNTQQTRQWIAPTVLQIPNASFANNTSGVVDSNYTQQIKAKLSVLNPFIAPNGRIITFLDSLTDKSQLPDVSNYNVGDYVIVKSDYTQNQGAYTPSTMYVILPGYVTAVTSTYHTPISTTPAGVCIASVEFMEFNPDAFDINTYFNNNWANKSFYGRPGLDYFKIIDVTNNYSYCYVVSYVQPEIAYSSAIRITGEMQLATESNIGGFLNVPQSSLAFQDDGYVYLDENGYLRIVDYALLRLGLLASQLGEDVNLSNLTSDVIQSQLDDHVNNRIVFPTSDQIDARKKAGQTAYLDVVNVTIELPNELNGENTNEYVIGNIDSRFNGILYLHLKGSVNSTANYIIKLVNCERIRIDSNIPANCTITLENCGLYYDYTVLNRLDFIEDLKLWYTQFVPDDPMIAVSGMKVEQISHTGSTYTKAWTSQYAPNDSEVKVALMSITFDSNGIICGAEVDVQNNITNASGSDNDSIYVTEFELKQGDELQYPETRLLYPIQIEGRLTTTSQSTATSNCVVTDMDFAIVTQYPTVKGSMAMRVKSTILPSTNVHIDTNSYVPGTNPVISGWTPDTWHRFSGAII